MSFFSLTLSYHQIEEGTCLLSSKTGSDVGGLYNQGFSGVHHFEMKPILGKLRNNRIQIVRI